MRQRIHDAWRHEYQELGIGSIERLRSKQLSQDRDVPNSWHLAELHGCSPIQ